MLTVEGLVTGSGDVVALHEALGKILRTFEHSASLRGTDDGDGLGAGICLQFVVEALYQRVLGAYDHHVDAFLYTEGLDGLEVVSLHGDVLTAVAGAGVTWGDIEFLTLAALSNLPCQGVFTTATS